MLKHTHTHTFCSCKKVLSQNPSNRFALLTNSLTLLTNDAAKTKHRIKDVSLKVNINMPAFDFSIVVIKWIGEQNDSIEATNKTFAHLLQKRKFSYYSQQNFVKFWVQHIRGENKTFIITTFLATKLRFFIRIQSHVYSSLNIHSMGCVHCLF